MKSRMTIDDQNGLTEVENKWLFCRIKDTLKSIGRLQLNGGKRIPSPLKINVTYLPNDIS